MNPRSPGVRRYAGGRQARARDDTVMGLTPQAGATLLRREDRRLTGLWPARRRPKQINAAENTPPISGRRATPAGDAGSRDSLCLPVAPAMATPTQRGLPASPSPPIGLENYSIPDSQAGPNDQLRSLPNRSSSGLSRGSRLDAPKGQARPLTNQDARDRPEHDRGGERSPTNATPAGARRSCPAHDA